MTHVITYGIDALSQGGLDGLAALGIALIFGVMRLINFAQTAFITLGGYMILLLGSSSWPVVVAITVIVIALLAVATERVAFRPIREANMATLLVTSFAVSSFLQNVLIMIAGAQTQGVAFGASLLRSFSIGGAQVNKLAVVTIGVSLGLLGLVAAFLRNTRTGVELRAATENFRMARMLGVRANRVIAVAFAISGGLAAAVSFLVTAQSGSLTPTSGLQPAIVGFVATVIGGMGSLVGAVAGGFALGVATVIFQVALPSGAAPYNQAFVFAIVFLLLVVRPQGLMGAGLIEERA